LSDIIVSLDIGSSKVRAIVGEVKEQSINIIGVGTSESEGIRKGSIVDIDQTVQSIREAVDNAERMVGVQINEVYVSILGSHIALQQSQGVVAVSNADREITDEDIERVYQAAKVIALPPEREIISVIPQQFVVDGLDGIQDPRGMIGVRLEVEATIITGAKTAIHNLLRCIERAELVTAGLILAPLASSQLSLTKDELAMGTYLVDIGAGQTTISVFEQGNLVAISSLPIGGEYITSDISIGLRTSTEVAERIKLKYGCASAQLADADQQFKVSRMGTNQEKDFSQLELANIIEPRVQEIFHLINQEVVRLARRDVVAGFVLTGGTVAMPGMLEVANQELILPARIATPDFIGVRDPGYTNGVGLVQFVSKNIRNRTSANVAKASASAKAVPAKAAVSKKQPKPVKTKSQEGGFMDKLKEFLSDFI
jgi:cell division protein FtsA